VQHAAVVTGLVGRHGILLLEDDEVEVGARLEQAQGGGQADDASPDDDEVGALGWLPRRPRRCDQRLLPKIRSMNRNRLMKSR
jgi:hypothetical protein